ncbi:PETER PAN-like protein [Quillaja saponaria]|uniref:PETER PAN-like protein n=1 Tax=Quillaja saponaria TaxID=32244 RepID=A0AAD7VEJ5_QUISA|nr:PETER PAN-like protein [Quillaja saponaria]
MMQSLRISFLPHTAFNLKEKKWNKLKDFLNVSWPLGVTHFLMIWKTAKAPYLRFARISQGATLTFKIHEYSLVADIARSQLCPRFPQYLFRNYPLIVLSGFVNGDSHTKLIASTLRNLFPQIDLESRNFSSTRRIVIRRFVQNHQVPDLRNLQDVSEFVAKAGYESESEADDEAASVTLKSESS